MSTRTVNGELEAEPFQKVNPDHLELRTEGVNEAASIWDAESFLLRLGARGCGGRQERGLGANPPADLATGPDGLLPTGWVLVTGVRAWKGTEQPRCLPKDNE